MRRVTTRLYSLWHVSRHVPTVADTPSCARLCARLRDVRPNVSAGCAHTPRDYIIYTFL